MIFKIEDLHEKESLVNVKVIRNINIPEYNDKDYAKIANQTVNKIVLLPSSRKKHKSKYFSIPKSRKITIVDNCKFPIEEMVYMCDGMYIHKNDCWW